MATFIGIDGFPNGWVAVEIDDSGRQWFGYATSIGRLLAAAHTRAMIDMPIGLPARGFRRCDEEARMLVGPCVFTGARRDVWMFPTSQHANEHYWADQDKGISQQLWGLRDKLREIDEFMSPARQQTMHEAHPELIFRRLNRHSPLASKKTDAGREQRIAILERKGLTQVRRWLGQRAHTGVGRDDLIDACACAIAARDATDRLPDGVVPLDARGLRMEIWY